MQDVLDADCRGQGSARRLGPARAFVDLVWSQQKRNLCNGRGKAGTRWAPSVWSNLFRVRKMGRDAAIDLCEEHIRKTHNLCNNIWKLSGKVLLCGDERCHADVLIKLYDERDGTCVEDGSFVEGRSYPQGRSLVEGPRTCGGSQGS